jgi:hypothetical protein
MGLFGRLLGSEPPKVPAGATLVLCDNQSQGSFAKSFVWWWAYVLPGDEQDDVSKQHKISPTFTDVTYANAWKDWLDDPKGHPFQYPAGAV